VDRRRFLLTSLAGALAAPLAGGAQQQAGKVYRVGILSLSAQADSLHLFDALEQGLRDRGYVDGRNITLEYRFAERRMERLPVLAAELVRLKVDLILAANNSQATAARQATTTIPIVMSLASDPVGEGLVASLARPGGNITGLTTDVTPETWGKRLQLLKELVPKISRAAVLSNSAFRANAARWKPTQDAARQLGVTLLPAEIRGPDDLENAFAIMVQARTEGFVVFTDPVTHALRSQMAGLAAKNRLPAVYPWREAVDAGGLLSYGPDFSDLVRRAATYIDKILQGAKPGDLPMEQPTKFELVVNLRTAKTLGLTIPPSLLARADQVIE
jgi:putative tryptophan/tyrosine transport system substrate-binding protein